MKIRPPAIGKGGAPTPFVNAFNQPAVGSLRYNTSQQGTPLPVIYGTVRVSINLLELWGFAGGPAKGGKGGSGSSGGKNKKTANYSTYVAMAICQGPTTFTGAQYGSGGNNRIWSNDGIAYGPGTVSLNGFNGTDGQAPDSTFVSLDPNSPVLGYSGTTYTTGDPMQLGQSPALPNISFEMSGLGSTGWWAIYSSSGYQPGGAKGSPAIPGLTPDGVSTNFPDDCNPAAIVVDIASNPRYGATYPAANLDLASGASIAEFAQYCIASSLAMSLILDREQPAARWIEEVCQLTVTGLFYTCGLLKFVPYATAAITGNGVTWTPDLTVQYSVADRDLLSWGGESDPVVITVNDPSQRTNWFGQEYYDSSNSFNPNISYQFNQGAIDEYSLRSEPVSEAHSLTNLTSANSSTQLQLQRKQNVTSKYKFQLGWTFCLLDPMDIIEITDIGAGLNATPVRIISIEEDDNGQLTFEAENLPGVATQLPGYAMQVPASQTPNVQSTPGNANAPIIFEPNAPLSTNSFQVWIVSSGGDDWGGANVWVSPDGTTYQMIGTIYAGNRQGVTTAILASYGGANPDTTHTLSVDLTESDGELNSGSASDAANFVTLCYIDGELLSYETATLTSTNKYDLTTLYRGLFGTVAGSHASGSQFSYIGLANDQVGVFKYNYQSNLVGQTIYIKLQSFNTFLQNPQELSDLTPVTYTLTGAGVVNPVNVPFQYNGVVTNSALILNYTFGAGDNFPVNLAGSVCSSAVAATAMTTFNINKNGVNFGTMTFAATATSATFAAVSAESFVPGDILTIVANRTDATLANLTGNLAGTS